MLCVFYSAAQSQEVYILGDNEKIEVKNETSCIKKKAFGLDVGIGGRKHEGTDESLYSTNIGIRSMRNFMPYFGVDFIKFNNIFSTGDINGVDCFSYCTQLMTGLRGYSPTFFKCMSAYGAVRLGYGVLYDRYSYSDISESGIGYGVCSELEIGINITRTVFVGFAYNMQGGKFKYFDDDDDTYKLDAGYPMLRIGFNF
jgi:hypothetical protein